jgi:multiple sugar transport system permease protein
MQRWIRKNSKHYLMLLPFFGLYILFFIYPTFSGIVVSFHEWDGVHQPEYLGIENYLSIIASPNFTKSFGNLIKYVGITIPINMIVAFALAVLVDSFKDPWAKIFRSMYFVPVMMPLFLSASIWRWLYSPDVGFINTMFGWFGIPNVGWLTDPDTMIYSLIIVDVWASAGFNMLILLGGMKNIPRELYDAAKVDGANKIQEIIHITIPQLEPIFFFVITYGFISALQVFDVPWILTASKYSNYGGRQQALLFPVMAMMGRAFGSLKFGQATAYGLILMFFIMLLTIVQFAMRKRTNEG